MGCDIHMAVEVKRYGRWVFADIPVYDDRCYDVFAMLADVRNGHGFAGIKTGNGWEPIAAPRGFPPDASIEALTTANGDHTPTWLLASEVFAYFDREPEPVGHLTGIVPYETWAKRRGAGETGMPQSWSGGISGPGIVVIDEAAARAGVTGSHVRIEWNVTARRRAERFLAWLEMVTDWEAERRWRDDPDGDVTYGEDVRDSVRLVFNFDS